MRGFCVLVAQWLIWIKAKGALFLTDDSHKILRLLFTGACPAPGPFPGFVGPRPVGKLDVYCKRTIVNIRLSEFSSCLVTLLQKIILPFQPMAGCQPMSGSAAASNKHSKVRFLLRSLLVLTGNVTNLQKYPLLTSRLPRGGIIPFKSMSIRIC